MIYRTLVADPPWNETGGGKIKRGADRHYPLMRRREIEQLLAGPLLGERFKLAEHAHLYLWVTNNFLEDGLRLMGLLGFRYITTRPWVKAEPSDGLYRRQRPGLGQYFRGDSELLLFGVKGKGKHPSVYRTTNPTTGRSPFIPTALLAPRTPKHSQKPAQFYADVEKRSHGPYLELFARTERPGWTAWGPHEGLEG